MNEGGDDGVFGEGVAGVKGSVEVGEEDGLDLSWRKVGGRDDRGEDAHAIAARVCQHN